MEMFVVPTHRKCNKAILSMIHEIKLHKEVTNTEAVMVVLDNSVDSIFSYNRKFLKLLKQKTTIKIYHISMLDISKLSYFIAKDLTMDVKYLKSLIIPKKIDYGKMFNIIYLISFIIGAEKIHRRDSDCFFDLKQKRNMFPVVKEMEYLGSSIMDIIKNKSIDVIDDVNYKENEKINIVGGGYVGNWNLDLHEIIKSNSNVANKLLEICDIPTNCIEVQVKSNYSNVLNKRTNNQKDILKSSFKVPNYPECGNISIYEIHKYIPNFIGENGIGFDYFTYFISFLYKVPIIYHQAYIPHIHDDKRYIDIDLYKYWLGIIKMVDLDLIYTNFIQNNRIDILLDNCKGMEAIKNTYDKKLPDLLENTIESISVLMREQKFNNIIYDILIDSKIAKYVKVAEELLQNKSRILSTLTQDYQKSISLQRLWKNIVESSKKQAHLVESWEVL